MLGLLKRGSTFFTALGLVALGGCSLLFNATTEEEVADVDGGSPSFDAAPLTSCEQWDPAPEHFAPCSIPEPTRGLDLDMAGTYVLNTEAGTLVDPNQDPVELTGIHVLDPNGSPALLLSLAAFRLDSNSILRVNGTRSLVIASWTLAAVSGTIDVASDSGETGAGAKPGPDCISQRGSNGSSIPGTGGGGGGGGAFQSNGGNGGGGDNGSSLGGGAGQGLPALPPMLRAGCPGGTGGGNADPGAGGGAIEIAAANAIGISGAIYAGGAGGSPGGGSIPAGGGGGGGSGGWIGLDAPTIVVSGSLAANGGGGGGGGGDLKNGEPGADAVGLIAAAGGPGGNDGGRGGNGASPIDPVGASGNQGLGGSGGGGGGGGAGFIVAFTADLKTPGANISPAIRDARAP